VTTQSLIYLVGGYPEAPCSLCDSPTPFRVHIADSTGATVPPTGDASKVACAGCFGEFLEWIKKSTGQPTVDLDGPAVVAQIRAWRS